jgi:hypothetical protein
MVLDHEHPDRCDRELTQDWGDANQLDLVFTVTCVAVVT